MSLIKQVIEDRLKRVRAAMAQQDLDALMVLVGENRDYLSGFSGEDTQFDESAGALFISASRLVLATDSRYEEQAKQEAPGYEVLCYPKGLAKSLPAVVSDIGARRLGFESVRTSYRQHQTFVKELKKAGVAVQLVPTLNIVENLRVIKSDDEIDRTRAALRLAEAVFLDVIRSLEPGMSEGRAAWAMERGMREAGAQALAFPTIVAAGPNSALPHAVPGRRRIKAHEPLLFDWGARLNGYCSDTSRTITLGEPDETFIKVAQTVLDAQKKGIEAIRTGVDAREVDAIARKIIDENGFKGKFGHGLGHGTGLAIHEEPRLSPLSDRVLQSGMLVTVEPGIYLPGWGGVRIENQVVVRDDGAQVLNTLPTDPAELW